MKMFRIGLILGFLLTPFVASAWTLAWDANPPTENVVAYGVYEDGVEIDVVTVGTEWLMPDPLPNACWQVDARNGYGLQSDLSSQVCVGRPSAPSGPRIIQ